MKILRQQVESDEAIAQRLGNTTDRFAIIPGQSAQQGWDGRIKLASKAPSCSGSQRSQGYNQAVI